MWRDSPTWGGRACQGGSQLEMAHIFTCSSQITLIFTIPLLVCGADALTWGGTAGSFDTLVGVCFVSLGYLRPGATRGVTIWSTTNLHLSLSGKVWWSTSEKAYLNNMRQFFFLHVLICNKIEKKIYGWPPPGREFIVYADTWSRGLQDIWSSIRVTTTPRACYITITQFFLAHFRIKSRYL